MNASRDREACQCLAKGLSVNCLDRDDARTFGVPIVGGGVGPWCMRCGRPCARSDAGDDQLSGGIADAIRKYAVLDAMRAVLECGPMRLLSPTQQKLVRDELLDAAWRVLDVIPGLRASDGMSELIGQAVLYGARPAAERMCRPDINVKRCGTHHLPLIDGKCKDSPKETP